MVRLRARLAALLAAPLLLAGAPQTSAPDAFQPRPPAPRAEVPIIDRPLSDGVHRYGVPVTIGETPVLAGLDTGASGLRIMPDALPAGQTRGGAGEEVYAFGSGAQLHGQVGAADITIGALSGSGSVHLVQAVDCREGASPNCPGRLGLGYGFLGDGLPHEGFRVLLGANMGRSHIDNPLIAVGAERWIIELPRPGETKPGRLIINPTDEELAGFTMVRLLGGFREAEGGGLHDSVLGCLRNPATEARACGPVAMDTGSYILRVYNSTLDPKRWPAGAAVRLEFNQPDWTPAAAADLVVGQTAQTLYFMRAPRRETMVHPGVAPYYAFSILYDVRRRSLGFKPRPPIDGLPAAAP